MLNAHATLAEISEWRAAQTLDHLRMTGTL